MSTPDTLAVSASTLEAALTADIRAVVVTHLYGLVSDIDEIAAVAGDGEAYVAHLAVLLAEDRERLRAALEDAGIGTGVHYPTADHRQPAWRSEHTGVSLPATEHAVDHVLTLPCFPELTEAEIDRVCEALGGC
jgi:dTDP-4-amino-4,6-dideoxygalactose transaminase